MSDTISRQAAIDACHRDYDNILYFTSDGKTIADSFEYILNALPPAEPQRKTGRWIEFDKPWWKCSECGAVREQVAFMENYCPNCGAKMDKE